MATVETGTEQPSENRPSPPLLPILFGATLFLSAMLLFVAQPLAGKILLPLLGGTPSVWNTVMVFFQLMLLLGYAYAHFSTAWLGSKQPFVHCALLLLAAAGLPFTLQGGSHPALLQDYPAAWILVALGQSIGLPVFMLASTAPLLQQWFASSSHRSAGDPYFLYAASNLGSFGALLAYPAVIEPFLRLAPQTQSWTAGFWGLSALVMLCAALVWKNWARQTSSAAGDALAEPSPSALPELPKWARAQWIGLSFVPSSLMLGVTTYITTDVASVPLLWLLPLGLYLLTFVIAFSRHGAKCEEFSARAIPILALAVVFPMLVQATEPVLVLVLLHLLFFFLATLRCHLKLARNRPPAGHLTRFYLALSLGGVLGGAFNALLAPLLFTSVVEYPLMILVATLIGYPPRGNRKPRFVIRPVQRGAIVAALMVLGGALIAAQKNVLAGNLLAGLFLLGAFLLGRHPVRYVIAMAALLAGTSYFRQARTGVVERDRNFFGVLRVSHDPIRPLRLLHHGTTIHGMQFTLPERRCEPLSYYHTQGPVGEIARLFEQSTLPPRVGLIGLGVGAMVSYAKPGQHWTIYEIDPAVIRIAQNTNYFTYLSSCAAAPFQLELGDARLRIQTAPDGGFGLIYVDAFSSDTIPIHLLTREAIALYRRKLHPDGLLAFHLSSRHFELEALVANLGRALGLECYVSVRGELDTTASNEGGLESHWAILAPPAAVPAIRTAATWRRVIPSDRAPLWTDDFSSLLGVLKWH